MHFSLKLPSAIGYLLLAITLGCSRSGPPLPNPRTAQRASAQAASPHIALASTGLRLLAHAWQNGIFEVAVYGLTNGHTYAVQLSLDLTNWSTRVQTTWTGEPEPWTPPINSPYPQAHFRVADLTQPSGSVLNVTTFGGKENDTVSCAVECAAGVAVGGALDAKPFLQTPAFTTHFAGPASGEVRALAVDPAGNFYATGWFYGTLDFGAGPLTTIAPGKPWGENQIFIAKFSPAGQALWVKQYGAGEMDPFQPSKRAGTALAFDSARQELVAAGFDHAGGALGGAGYLLRLSADGLAAHVQTLPKSTPYALAIAPDGLYVTGATSGDFGPLKGRGDAFLAKYANTNLVWSRTFGTNTPFPSTASGQALAVSSDAIYAAGFLGGSMTFGGTNLFWQGQYDGWIARFDQEGNHLWSQVLGSTALEKFNALALNDNSLLLAGNTNNNARALSLDLDGRIRWSKNWPNCEANAAAGHTIAGRYHGLNDFGQGAVASTNGTWDGFAIQFAP